MTYFTPLNPVIHVTSLTSNLTAPLAHLTILHYSVHTYLPLKFLTALSSKLCLPSGLIYQPPWKPLLTQHITSLKTIIPPLCQSHSSKLNFALNFKLSFSTNRTLLNLLIPASDWPHISLSTVNQWRCWPYQSTGNTSSYYYIFDFMGVLQILILLDFTLEAK